METFITTNDMLKQTELVKIFHQATLQQQTAKFLDAMHEKYGEDKQFKYIMNEIRQDGYRPMSIENPFKSAKVAGYMARMYNWIRDHELQQLQEEYEKAQTAVVNARSTGRRKDINKALESAGRLQGILQERYEGRLWHEETVAEQIDPRLKRTDENLQALNELKGKIQEFIKVVNVEFDVASKQDHVDGEK
jgi:hypothetical protein